MRHKGGNYSNAIGMISQAPSMQNHGQYHGRYTCTPPLSKSLSTLRSPVLEDLYESPMKENRIFTPHSVPNLYYRHSDLHDVRLNQRLYLHRFTSPRRHTSRTTFSSTFSWYLWCRRSSYQRCASSTLDLPPFSVPHRLQHISTILPGNSMPRADIRSQ